MTELDRLIAKLEPELRRAFEAAMHDWRAKIDDVALIAALRRSDIEAAISALHLDPAVFNQYGQIKSAQFAQFGQATVRIIEALPNAPTFRFAMTNPRAENIMQTQIATRIAGYTREQTDAARRVIS